jgi:hypothetical protein
MRWGPLQTALAYALVGPAIGVGLMLALFSPTIVDLGTLAEGPFWDLVLAIYIIGAPPLAATGLIVGASAARGARLPTLTLLSAVLGALFAAVSALLWAFLGSVLSGPGWETIVAIAVAGAIAGFGSALVVALLSLFRRRAAS